MLVDDSSPHAAETLWLLRHAAQSIQARRPMPSHTRYALAARNLSSEAGRFLVVTLAEFVQRPLRLAPPCSTWRSDHEVLLVRAMAAVEQDRGTHARYAIAQLAAPGLLTRREIDAICALIAMLSGCYTPASSTPMTRPGSDSPDTVRFSPKARHGDGHQRC